ncbi:MAG: pilus assembly protein [Chloroflexi bacterium]|nr:pilus assembly protein [Chloroflexota bacterium]
MVEFALILVPFILLVLGVFDFGRSVYQHNMLSNAAREATRAGITGRSAKEVCEIAVRKSFVPYASQNPTCTSAGEFDWPSAADPDLQVRVEPGDLDAGTPIHVTITHRFKAITPLIDRFINSAQRLRASSKMGMEEVFPTPNPLTPSPTPKATYVPPTPTNTPTIGPSPTATNTPTATATPMPCTINATVTVSTASGVYGGTLSELRANISPSQSNLWVDFYLNGTSVGADRTTGSGVAKLTNVRLPSSIAVGSYPTGITARLRRDGSYCEAWGEGALTVTQAGTTTAPVNQAALLPESGSVTVTLTANVTANSPSIAVVNDEGTVTFTVPGIGGPVTSGTVINGVATATLTIPAGTSPGNYTIQAQYTGGTNFAASAVAGTATLSVRWSTTLEVLTSITAVYGDPAAHELRAKLTHGTTPVAGKTIQFTFNGSALCNAPSKPSCPTTDASGEPGVATLSNVSIVGINAGSYPSGIGASFAGDASYAVSSGTNSLTIAKADTATDAGNATTVYGSTSVTLTAGVTPLGPSTATVTGGTVEFTVVDGLIICEATGTVTNGTATATCITSGAELGTYQIQARYVGGSNHYPSDDPTPGTLTITKANTTTTVVDRSVTYGTSSITLTANVTADAPSIAVVDEGTVTFTVKQGTNPVGSAGPVSVVEGVATTTFDLTGLLPAPYTIEATYSGGTHFNGSDGTGTLLLNKRATSLAVSAVTHTYGDPSTVTLTATLTSSGTPVDGKTISFTLNGVAAGTATTDASGVATLPNVSLTGINTGAYGSGIQAAFAGDQIYAGLTGTNSLTIAKANTTTTTANMTVPYGATITLTANVTANSPSTAPVNEGTVRFRVRNGGTVICDVRNVSVSGGVASASCNIGTAAVGSTWTLQADYSGGTNFNSSSGTATLTVTKANTTTTPADKTATLAASGPTSVTLTATVTADSPSTATVTQGTVMFTVKSGTTTIGSPVTGTVTDGAVSVTYSLPAGTAAGTYTIEADYSGGTNFNTSSDTATLTVDRRTTSLSVAAAGGTYGGTTTLSATLTSGGTGLSGKTISFTLNGTTVGSATTNASGVATLANVSLAGIAAGTYPTGAGASFAGDAIYDTASGSNSLTVDAAGTATTANDATGTSGSNVTLSTTVTSATGATVSEGTVTFTVSQGMTTVGTAGPAAVAAGTASADFSLAGVPAGSYTITADFSGSTNFTASSGTATLTVNTQATSLGTASAAGTFGGTATLSATLTANGTPLAGYVVDFTLNGTPAGNATTDASGVATLSNVSLAGIDAGMYPSGVGAGFAGDPFYTPSSGTNALTVSQAAATIAFDAATLSQAYDGTPKAVTATTTPAGLSYSVTYDGSPAAPTNAGSYSVVATITDPNYSGSTSGTLAIAKADQTIGFGPLASKTYGDPPFDVSATASSGLPLSFSASGDCTISGTTVTLTGAGSCTVTASQPGDANYNAAPDVAQSFTISAAAATIALDAATLSQSYDGTPKVVTATTNPAGLSYSVTYDGSTAAPTNAGSYVVAATITDPNYSGSTNDTLTISKASTTTTATNTTATAGATSVTLSANVTSAAGTVNEGSVGFTVADSLGNTVCSASGMVVSGAASAACAPASPLAAGSYTITAAYGGSANFAASSGTATLTVNAQSASLSPASASGTYGGTTTLSATLTSGASPLAGYTVSFTLNGAGAGSAITDAAGVATLANASLAGIAAGTYPSGLGASFAGDPFYAAASGTNTLTVNQAAATIALDAATLSPAYDGTPKTVTATTNPAGLSYTVTYDGSPAAPANAGSYSVVATITDPNYSGSATGTLTIAPANTTTAPDNATAASGATSITLTASVTSGAGTLNEGGVDFTITDASNATVCTATGTVVSGAASADCVPAAPFVAGTYTITAAYGGSTNFNSSSGIATLTVT